jgi:hypothetical protein
MDLILNIIGVIGLVILLVALILNVRKRTRQRVVLYYLMQFFGAGFLCVYAYLTNSQIFFILQGIWVIVSAYFLYENTISAKNKNIKIKKKIKK